MARNFDHDRNVFDMPDNRGIASGRSACSEQLDPTEVPRTPNKGLAVKLAPLDVVCVAHPRTRINHLPARDNVFDGLDCLYAR